MAERLSGELEGDASRRLTDVAPVERAGRTDLTFVMADSYVSDLHESKPGAALVSAELDVSVDGTALIRVEDAQAAFARAVRLFHPAPEPEPGVADSAVVAPEVELGEEVSIADYVVIGDGARIGDGTRIGPHTVVAPGVEIGEDCEIAEGCSLQRGSRIGDRVVLHPGARVGTEGYGWVLSDRPGARKMPQVGGCILEDDVEVGANTTIDRGTLDDTVIGAGTKIDNLVHVGHNVRIGRDCMIVAQVGLAGSATVGDRVQLAGQAGVSGHLTIGDGARIAAQAGVIGDVPAGATYSGYPARPHREAMRASASLFRLPEFFRRLRRLEARVEDVDDARMEDE